MVTIEQLNSEIVVEGDGSEASGSTETLDEAQLRALIRRELRRLLERRRRTEAE